MASKPGETPQVTTNIEASQVGSVVWNPADVNASLMVILRYVETEAAKTIGWYWKNKGSKSFLSRWIQFLAVVLTAMAGLLPIIGKLFPGIPQIQDGLASSLLVGLAATLLGLDKAFGFSSGWARYVLAATNIRSSLEDFRMDWVALSSKISANPTAEQIDGLIQRAKTFRVSVENVVMQETKDWVTEFRANMAQLEKEVGTQLDKLKVQVEQAAQAKQVPDQPGSISLEVPNADKADNATIQIQLDGAAGKITDDTVVGGKTWVRINVAPGQYKLTVRASAGGKPVQATAVVTVKAAEAATAQISLPV